MSSTIIQDANDTKADFDLIYNQPDPRRYFQALRVYDYQIPERAKSMFLPVFANFQELRNQTEVSIVDVGCSYGLNGALLKYDLDLDELYNRYADPSIADLPSSEIEERDRDFFTRLPRPRSLHITGLDIADNAVRYGEAVSVLDHGIHCDFESRKPDANQTAALSQSDIIISTGCVGYVTDKTFACILDTVERRKPWVASFVLRMFPYDAISRRLADHGLVTAKLTGQTFVQRRFVDEEEQSGVMTQLQERNITTTGLEDRGYFHAEFFLSVPEAESRELPLQGPWQIIAQP